MKLAVIGSRSFHDYDWLELCLLRSFRIADIEAVITGGAQGADALAARFASLHSIPLTVIAADWALHGKKAGPIRNTDIVRQCDALAAFWDGHSAGTRDSIAKARTAGKRMFVYPCSPAALPLPDVSASRISEKSSVDPESRRRGEARQLLFSDILFPER
ncbi:MAG: DUF2493 domain-containing protein [Mailhella sp.]|nr:DUF2493 domain-containing protein [Mailhella sp.]